MDELQASTIALAEARDEFRKTSNIVHYILMFIHWSIIGVCLCYKYIKYEMTIWKTNDGVELYQAIRPIAWHSVRCVVCSCIYFPIAHSLKFWAKGVGSGMSIRYVIYYCITSLLCPFYLIIGSWIMAWKSMKLAVAIRRYKVALVNQPGANGQNWHFGPGGDQWPQPFIV